MRSDRREAGWAVSLSVRAYRRLLAAYPRAFRQRYGAPMVQVFRDCCRDAERAAGAGGICQVWLMALSDLAVSALKERRQEEVHMSRLSWIRLGSLAALIGGSVGALSAGLALVLATAQLLDEQSSLALAVFPVQVAVSRAGPVLWLLFVLALIGLQARGAGRAGVLGWVGITVAALGAVVTGLGNGLDAVIMASQADGCRTPQNCNYYDPDHYLYLGFMAGLLGSVIFASGMIVSGIPALRRRVLSRHNGLPLLVGVMALLGVAAAVIATFTSPGIDGAGLQKVAIMFATVALVAAVVWVLLGAAMWPRGDEEVIVQAAV